MDTLEVITADTTLENEIEFLRFVRRNRDVRIISTHATFDGPKYLSAKDILEPGEVGSSADCTFLLWNTSIPNPLCWSLYLDHYDAHWLPVDPRYANPIKYPQSEQDLLDLHSSFRQKQITAETFRYGRIDCLLSPVIEVNVASKREDDFFSVTAMFSNVVRKVWLAWDAYEAKWAYESRDLQRLIWCEFQQPSEFLEWQQDIFSWVRETLSDRLISRFTYRLGPDDSKECLLRLAQSLADLYGHDGGH